MLTKYNCLILLSICGLCVITSAAPFNNTDIPSCSEKDENINECLKKVFQQMIPRSKYGIPEIGIPPMDPFQIRKINFVLSSSIINGKLGLRNISMHGLSDTITKSVVFERNGNNASLTVKAFIPKVFLEGKFLAKIHFNAAKISSKGSFNMTMTDVDLWSKPESELYERDGHLYMRLKKFDISTRPANFHFAGENIIPDPLLNQAINDFINQSWKSLYHNLITETRAAWEPELVKLGNEYFSRVAIDSVLKNY